MKELPFITNQIYKRSEVHDLYGGSRQGGISPSAKYPYIFIFSGQTGHQHGYKDQWENPDVFSYTGEGQVGDMNFIKGNLALRNHLINNKRVFLFMQIRKAFIKFEAELDFLDFDFFEAIDTNNNKRIAIKFFFKRTEKYLNYESMVHEPSIPIERNFITNIPNETEREGLVTSRVGQGAYRKSILFRWSFKCAVTNYQGKEILIASHIVPWKDSTNEERMDVNNGILLSPNYDALFDQNLISFENNGKIILSESLSKTNYQNIGVTGTEKIRNFSADNNHYLERHRLILKV